VGPRRAEQVLEPALALGKLTEADYTLVQAASPLLLAGEDVAGYSLGAAAESFIERLRQDAQAHLERVARRLRAEGLRVETRVVVGEQPAVAILDEARARPTDLIALATHGRRGVARLLLGSVADQVVRGAAT